MQDVFHKKDGIEVKCSNCGSLKLNIRCMSKEGDCIDVPEDEREFVCTAFGRSCCICASQYVANQFGEIP